VAITKRLTFPSALYLGINNEWCVLRCYTVDYCWLTGTLSVRRVGRYEVVTYQNATVPDVIVHAAADTKPTSLSEHPASDHVTDDVTLASTAGVWAGALDDGRKLSTCSSGASSSLPQLSVTSGRQQSALDQTGNNNVSLSALHASAYVDAASQRQTLIRSRACRPCHDLSKVTVDRPRFGSHFRLSATVADIAFSGGERSAITETHHDVTDLR